MNIQMSLLEEPHVNLSQSRDLEKDLMTLEETSPLSNLRLLKEHLPGGYSWKPSPESCHQTEDGTLEPSSGHWQNSGMGSPTAFLTLKASESRNAAAECSLSDILEDAGNVPPRFYLTPKACKGILRRAENRKREIPAALREALESVTQNQE